MVPAAEEQEKLLADAVNNVKCQSFQMQRCLDKSKLMDALKHANNLLSELRTSALSPRSYYELYMVICDELSQLEAYLLDEFSEGRKIPDLYELVQYAANILPRLYLLITVGLVYIKTNEYSRRDILIDLVEMCRGVQHPLRGLFLRNYLLQCSKKVLPDTLPPTGPINANGGPAMCASDGTIDDSIDFILVNFAEMNKLWVRIQHQGHSRDRERREKERMELRILVGTNLVRLSQLGNLSLDRYDQVVLPGILEQVLSCRDGISQEYIMECIVQVFPDDLHLATLPVLLAAISRLEPNVNVKEVIVVLIDRLAAYYSSIGPNSANQPPMSSSQLISIFTREIGALLKRRAGSMDAADMVSLQVSLANLATKSSISVSDSLAVRTMYLDSIFQSTLAMLPKFNVESVEHLSPVDRELLKLVRIALAALPPPSNDDSVNEELAVAHESGMLDMLLYKLSNFTALVGNSTLLSTDTRALIASCLLTRLFDVGVGDVLNAAIEMNMPGSTPYIAINHSGLDLRPVNQRAAAVKHTITRVEDLERLLALVVPPLVLQSPVDRVDRHVLVGGLVHYMVRPEETFEGYKTHLAMLQTVHKAIASANSPVLLGRLFTTIVMSTYKLVVEFASSKAVQNCDPVDRDEFVLSAIRFAHDECLIRLTSVGGSEVAEVVLRLYLQAVLTLDRIHESLSHMASTPVAKERETLAYEFMSQAFAIYEEDMSDRRSQLTALHLITGTLKAVCCSPSQTSGSVLSGNHPAEGSSSDVGGDSSREALLAQCRLAASTRVVRRADQCRGLLLTSHLAVTPQSSVDRTILDKEEKRVSDQMTKALKLATNSIDAATRLQLMIEILDDYLHFYSAFGPRKSGDSHLTVSFMCDLLTKIRSEFTELNASKGGEGRKGDVVTLSGEIEHARRHLANTMNHIKCHASGDDSGSDDASTRAAFSKLLTC